ncbi:MAG: sulfite exporter TauE/SafE family protein [Spirochaetes bacterium]|nr:sulfite exporter TauE/SafE family protein [Spirochaetota bacterium]
MFDLTPLQWLLSGIAGFFVGLAKTGISGLGIAVVPLMASVFPSRASTGIILPMLIMADIMAVLYYRRHAQWNLLLRIIPFSITGVIMGYFMLGIVNDMQMRYIIAIVIIVLLIVSALKDFGVIRENAIPTNIIFTATMGILAGMTTMLANAAGPIMVIYLLSMGLMKNEFIGTSSWYFLLINCFKVPFSASLGLITPTTLLFNVKLLPFIILGAVVGILIVKKIPQTAFRITVQVLAFAAAIKLIF